MIQPPAWRLLPVSTHFYARKEGRKCWGAPPSLGDPRPRTEAGLTTVTSLGGPAGGPALASLPRTVAPPVHYRDEAQRVTPRRPRSRFPAPALPCGAHRCCWFFLLHPSRACFPISCPTSCQSSPAHWERRAECRMYLWGICPKKSGTLAFWDPPTQQGPTLFL